MNNKAATAIASVLAASTFYWAFIRAIGSGWVEIRVPADLLRAVGRTLFAFAIDPLAWFAAMMACLALLAHSRVLRKRAASGLSRASRSIKSYKHYWLRLAFSAVCGIACLLLAMLWSRSYPWSDTLQGVVGSQRLQFTSELGQVTILVFPNAQSANFPKREWTLSSYETDFQGRPVWTFGNIQPNGLEMVVPHWFMISMFLFLAAITWIKWHFSIRTLLIAITLVATALGLIMASI